MNYYTLAENAFLYRKVFDEDICEHLDILKEYALKSKHITELGVRGIVSTYAFILGKPKKLISIDIHYPSFYLNDEEKELIKVEEICKSLNIDFKFVCANDLDIEIEETDLLFIDTVHTYDQLIQELRLHGNRSRKWIILHDTESCKEFLYDSQGLLVGGLEYAINEFLYDNKDWIIKEIYTNNNGLTILEKHHEN